MENLNREFVTYEQALALKELGFNEPCLAIYGKSDNNDLYYTKPDDWQDLVHSIHFVKAPLYQQAFRFFREKYGLYHFIEKDDDRFNAVVQSAYVESFDTYEQAEQSCLNKLIEICKDGKMEKYSRILSGKLKGWTIRQSKEGWFALYSDSGVSQTSGKLTFDEVLKEIQIIKKR